MIQVAIVVVCIVIHIIIVHVTGGGCPDERIQMLELFLTHLEEFSHDNEVRHSQLQRQREQRRQLDEGDICAAQLIGGVARLQNQPQTQPQVPPQPQPQEPQPQAPQPQPQPPRGNRRRGRRPTPTAPSSAFEKFFEIKGSTLTRRASTTELLVQGLVAKHASSQKQIDNQIMLAKLKSVQEQMKSVRDIPDIYDILKAKYMSLLEQL